MCSVLNAIGEFISDTWEVLVGVAAAILVPLVIEWYRKPRVEFLEHSHPQDGDIRIVHIRVTNRPTHLFSRALLRTSVPGCRLEATFTVRDGDQSPVRDLNLKWDRRPEPTLDLTALYAPSEIELHASDRGETAAIALKVRGQTECFAFGNRSYEDAIRQGKPWFESAQRQDLLLPGEEYVVSIMLEGGGMKFNERYLLRNYGTDFSDFSVELLDD